MRKEGWLVIAIATLFASTGCDVQANPTSTGPAGLTPVPELFSPVPTALRTPAVLTIPTTVTPAATVSESAAVSPKSTVFRLQTLFPTNTPTGVVSQPVWCERTPILVGTPEKSARENAYLFGTSFSYWFMNFKQESSFIGSMFSDVQIRSATFPGEDMDALTGHLKEISHDFHVQPNRKNVMLVQLAAIGLINGRDPDTVLHETIMKTKEIQLCFPEVKIILLAPIPNRQQDPNIQLTFAEHLAGQSAPFGWKTVDIGPLLMSDGKLNESLYSDTLHLKISAYERFAAPVIHDAIIR